MSRKRYFEENEPKYKAGVISDSLRSALNMGYAELPHWIYKMRVLGYPPGWLKTAEINTLSVIDGTDCNSNLITNTEDGEITGVQYNRESFIEYPGFNVELSPLVTDDWHLRAMPPMLPQQQLKEALKIMKTSSPVAYKKIKTDSFHSPNANKSHTSHENFNHLYTTKEDSKKIIDLENDCLKSCSNNRNDENDARLNLSEKHLIVDSDNSEIINENASESDFDNSTLNSSTNSDRKLKLVSMGSPMPSSSNPSRPSLEKWSIGMGELIYFENLPTSTGMYQNKMKRVINKIRQINNSKE